MLLASLWYFTRKKSGYRSSVVTSGTVKSLKPVSSPFVSTDSDGDMLFREEENIFKGDALAPLIEFTTLEGRTIEITGSSSKPPRYKVGDTVEILYAPTKPEKAIINSFPEKWLLAVFLLSFSGMVAVTGGLALFLFL